MSFETILASEKIYEGHLIDLRVDQVRTPAGLEAVREVIEHPGAVGIVALDDLQRVVLVKQYRHAVRAMTIEIPAGTLNVGEDPLAAAQRELREEIGCRAEHIERMTGIDTAPSFSTEHIHLYLATGLVPDRLAMDADEAIDVLRLSLPEAIGQIKSGAITDSKTVGALLLAQVWLDQ